jgi:hypothetical protein
MNLTRVINAGLLGAFLLTAAGCGGGSNSTSMTQPPPPPPPPPALDPQYRVSATSPFAGNCDGASAGDTFYSNAEVEPTLAINPSNTLKMAAAWQQDRWSSGGARGIVAGASSDGGKTWSQHTLAFSICGGGTPENGGDYERASDPWITAAPDGTLYLTAIAFSGGSLQPGSISAVVASRSTDGGMTWGSAQPLVRDVANHFNDKESITADPVTPHYVYAVWDRLLGETEGPTVFARSTDAGVTWEPIRTIYDPGVNNQTIANLIVVLPNGTLVNLFLEIDASGNNFTSTIKIIRSIDNGQTWSLPVSVADDLSVGTRDPDSNMPVRDGSLVPQIAVGPGGTLDVVWQDARFSSGVRDAIALSHSADGGLTWSAPVRVNSVATVAAFTPSVHVRGDGQIGVTYFDFRADTSTAATLLTEYWLARSSDGVQWHESQVAGPFDLTIAPLSAADGAAGYFLGDYQALGSANNVFVPLFVQTNDGTLDNRTDVFVAPAVSATNALAVTQAQAAPSQAVTLQFRQRVSDNLKWALRAHLPHWHANAGK